MQNLLPSAPYAMVEDGSEHAKSLAQLGWVVTDIYPGWLHMEPPL
jgi:hypothetical protein